MNKNPKNPPIYRDNIHGFAYAFWREAKKKNPRTTAALGFHVAEKEGFEPSRPFRGLHDFQGEFAYKFAMYFYISLLVLRKYNPRCEEPSISSHLGILLFIAYQTTLGSISASQRKT